METVGPSEHLDKNAWVFVFIHSVNSE